MNTAAQRPTRGGTPAAKENAMASGTRAKETVNPERRSSFQLPFFLDIRSNIRAVAFNKLKKHQGVQRESEPGKVVFLQKRQRNRKAPEPPRGAMWSDREKK
jgi:hypothetical protein